MNVEMTIRFTEQEVLDICREKLADIQTAVPGTWKLRHEGYGRGGRVTAEFEPASEGQDVDLAA